MGGVARSVVGVVKPVVEAVKPVVEAVKPVAGALRIATETLEFVFLQANEKQVNQTSCQ